MAFDIGNRPLRIAVGAGHANASGGNAYELGINQRTTNEFMKLARASTGFDVRCYTPNDGLGMSGYTLDNVVYATVHEWVKQGWLPDIVFEIHQEGMGNTSVRGGFVIHPDSTGLSGRKASGDDYIDNDVKAHAPLMAKIIAASYGGVTRGAGVMSERQTGVGLDGWRLGYFGALSDPYFQNNCCVFISEAATYTNPTDKALMDRPDFPSKQAMGLMQAVASLAVVRGNWEYVHKIGSTPAPTPAPEKPYPPAVSIPDVVKHPPTVVLSNGSVMYRADLYVKSVRDTPRKMYADDGSADIGPTIAKGTEFPVEYLIENPDGSQWWYTTWGTRVRKADTTIVRVA